MEVKAKMREKINNLLSDLSEDMVEELGSMLFWGEIEVPECMKNETEED